VVFIFRSKHLENYVIAACTRPVRGIGVERKACILNRTNSLSLSLSLSLCIFLGPGSIYPRYLRALSVLKRRRRRRQSHIVIRYWSRKNNVRVSTRTDIGLLYYTARGTKTNQTLLPSPRSPLISTENTPHRPSSPIRYGVFTTSRINETRPGSY